MDVIKDSWTEDEVASFDFESGSFDRKSGRIIKENPNALAKPLSAFANTNGGHLLLGVDDHGAFDGLDIVGKGRTPTIEWLNQKVTDLLAPPLRNFKIHLVQASTDSRIPEGKILIVIDIPKSEDAPHQSIVDYLYYQRLGSESKPIPHRYLELLFNRERFPGPNVAGAWLYRVINPLLSLLEQEIDRLSNEDWGFNVHNRRALKCVDSLYKSYNSGNAEQFLEHYEEILELIKQHDSKVQSFVDVVEGSFGEMCQIAEMVGLYSQVTSIEMLLPLKDEKTSLNYFNFKDCRERIDFVKKLFPNDDRQRNTQLLVEYLVNNTLRGSQQSTFAPLWDLHYEAFSVERSHTYREPIERIRECRLEVAEVVSTLYEALRKERSAICNKYKLPYEEMQQTVFQVPYERNPWT